MIPYTIIQPFAHDRASYAPGHSRPVWFSKQTGEALKRNGLVIDYRPPDFPAPDREPSSASRPGQASQKQTLKKSKSGVAQPSS